MKYGEYYKIGNCIVEGIGEDERFFYCIRLYEKSPVAMLRGETKWNKINTKTVEKYKNKITIEKIEKKDLFIQML